MKTLLTFCLVLLSIGPVTAQGLSPEAVNGAVIGGVAGAVIGNNSGSLGHNGLRGAAYGAGAGLIVGSVAGRDHDSRGSRHGYMSHRPSYVYRSGPSYYGYGHRGHVYRSYPSYYSYSARPYDSYGYSGYYDGGYSDYSYGRSNYIGNGLFWGALTGAILGNNSSVFGHSGLRGAAIGAGAGLLIGSVAESNARQREANEAQISRVSASEGANSNVEAQPRPSTPAPRVTAPAAISPMASANNLFGR